MGRHPEAKNLVRNFQCAGCIHGSDTGCGRYEKSESHAGCGNHHPSTFTTHGKILLGAPVGFNRLNQIAGERTITQVEIQIVSPRDYFDKFNVAVWKTRFEGAVLVRGLRPRTSFPFIVIFPDLGSKEYDSINCIEITKEDIERMD